MSIKINCALNANDGKVYFFVGEKVISYDEKTNKVSPGYPIAIDAEWKGLYDKAADAACQLPNGVCYFFKDDSFIRSTIKTKKVTAGYPKPIKGNWKNLWDNKIDACITIGETAYFFKGKECLIPGKKNENGAGFEGPKSIQHYFPGIWEDGIDAVVNWHGNGLENKIYFFKGDSYMRFDLIKNKVDSGYPMKITDNTWPGLADAINATSNVLKKKDETANLPSLFNLSVKLRWFKAVDFDLSAVYKMKTGEIGTIYFGNKGELSKSPFIKLDRDQMSGGNAQKEEIITIAKLDVFSEIYLICWDYSNGGGTGIFDDADVNITILDNNGNSVSTYLEKETGKDAACIAKIYSSSDGKYTIKNMSTYFKRQGSSDSKNILAKLV